MTESSIRDVQLAEFEILKAVTSFCEERNIRYVLHCGTLLGAVRHGGFIPWDDDIDIAMPLPDYQRFLAEAHELEGPFVVQTPTRDNHAPVIWSKVHLKGTTCMPSFAAPIDAPWGVYIEIYPLIGAAKGKVRSRLQSGALGLSNSLRLAEYGKCQLQGNVAGGTWERLAKRMLGALPYGLCRWLSDALYRASIKDPADSDRIGSIDAARFAGKFDAKWFCNPTTIEFEGVPFYAPSDSRGVLWNMYGDWRKLPPESERHPHYDDRYTMIRDVNRDWSEYRAELCEKAPS